VSEPDLPEPTADPASRSRSRLPLFGPQQARPPRPPRHAPAADDAGLTDATAEPDVEPERPVESPPPPAPTTRRQRRRARRGRQPATIAWTMAKCFLLASILALGAALWLALTPVQNPNVQDCGTPLGYVIVNRTNVRVSPDAANAPPDAAALALQPTCRERVDSQLTRALVAFGAFIGLGLLGAVVGLADDRWQYHRAPRFETLLRERPADAPGRIRPPPVIRPQDVGRRLPPIEAPDVWILVGLSVLVVAGLTALAGYGDVRDAFGAVGIGGIVVLGVLELATVAVATAQLWLTQPAPPPEPIGPAPAAAVELASAAGSRLLPGFGPLGFDTHALVAQGADRERVVRGQQARQFAGFAVHVGLAIVTLLVADVAGRPDATLPSWWWAPAVVGGALVAVGVARAVGRWRRLVVKPRWSALRDIGASGEMTRVGGIVGGALLLTVLNVAIFVVATSLVASAGLPPAATLSRLALIELAAWALGAVSPTPGGLGAFDAAALLGLLLVGIDPPVAVAAVVVFRLATLWVPVVVGLVPFTRFRLRWRRQPSLAVRAPETGP
jgi:uncharacterized membrane protein YbhN (UPF0104 family)